MTAHLLLFPCTFLLLLLATITLQQTPFWPANYAMHTTVHGTRNYEFDLYFDMSNARYRFDSYGVPLFLRKFVKQHNDLPKNNPLYIFLFRYDLGYLFSLWPGIAGWNCERTLLPAYPIVPSLFNASFVQGATFIGRSEPCDLNTEVAACEHFSRDFVLFAVDYFQDEKTQLPAYVMLCNAKKTFF